jgi:hypothetical protein
LRYLWLCTDELAVASVTDGFDAGNPAGTAGRLPSPVFASA